MPRVYVETSFLSACVSSRIDARSVYRREESQRWWVQQRGLHRLFVSAEVVRELSAPTYPHTREALLLTAAAELLPLDDTTLGFARILVRERVMPGPEQEGDALHVAVATVQQMDVILTWNVKHLANRNKSAHLREICRRVGYAPPEVLTPDLFWSSASEVEP